MTIDELDKNLINELTNFSEEMGKMYEESDKRIATKSDIHTLAQSSFYVMNAFRKQIITYLKSKE